MFLWAFVIVLGVGAGGACLVFGGAVCARGRCCFVVVAGFATCLHMPALFAP